MFHPSVTADTRVEGGTQGHAGATWTNVYTSNITPYMIQLATLQPDFMFSLVQVTSNFVFNGVHIVLEARGTLSLRKPVPAILAFISHFRLKQLDLRNDQVHVDRLAAVL